jgi:hypothetical protein
VSGSAFRWLRAFHGLTYGALRTDGAWRQGAEAKTLTRYKALRIAANSLPELLR